MNRTHAGLILFVLAFALLVRFAWIGVFPTVQLESDPFYYDQTARSILSGEGYRNGNLYAYRPPAYPYFLAGVYYAFGYHLLPVKVIQAVISVLSCLVLYLLARRLSGGGKTAVFALCAAAFYPPFIKYSSELWSETLFVFLLLSGVLFLYREVDRDRLTVNGVLSGLFLGGAALTREIAFYFIGFIGLWMALYRPVSYGAGRSMIKFALLAAAFGAVVTPWTIRNYHIFGKIIPITLNGGINYYIGNNEKATGGFLWTLPRGVAAWPDTIQGLAASQYKQLELETNRTAFREGWKYASSDPLRSVTLSVKKIFYLWMPPYSNVDLGHITKETLFRLAGLGCYSLLLAGGIAGVIYSRRIAGHRHLVLYFWLLLVTAAHMLTYATSRYQIPLIPFLILFSSLAFNELLSGAGAGRSASAERGGNA